jgi:hypothetical protein
MERVACQGFLDLLRRIEFGSVGSQVRHLDRPSSVFKVVLDNAAATSRQPVADDPRRHGDGSRWCLQELDHFRGVDCAGVQPEAGIPERQARDRQQTLPIEVILPDGSLPSRRPRSKRCGCRVNPLSSTKSYRRPKNTIGTPVKRKRGLEPFGPHSWHILSRPVCLDRPGGARARHASPLQGRGVGAGHARPQGLLGQRVISSWRIRSERRFSSTPRRTRNFVRSPR